LAHCLTRKGVEVSILTAMPNYPVMEIHKEYRGKRYCYEEKGGLKIHRCWIFVKKSDRALFRLFNYFSFVFSALFAGIIKTGKQDIIICESPPLFLGFTALLLKRVKHAKLIFNVSDLWPESVEKLGIIQNKTLLNLAYSLEKLIYIRSSIVSGQTQGILKSINNRFPNVKTFWLPNGIDFERYNINVNGISFRTEHNINNNQFVLLYAGVLGHAQGLEVIINAAEKTKELGEIQYFIIGDGPEKEKLIKLSIEKELNNLVFLPNKSREEIPGIIAACDAYIVPLKKNDLFLGAIPSKLFEPLAMGKPIILGVDGEARDLFIEKGKCGLYYEPENKDDLVDCIMSLYNNRNLVKELGERGVDYIRKNFDRSIIADKFYCQMIRLDS
jgi:glycosyltransferase involved in cell wall biosynthesis